MPSRLKYLSSGRQNWGLSPSGRLGAFSHPPQEEQRGQAGRQAGRQVGRQADRPTDKEGGRESCRQTDRQTDRQGGREGACRNEEGTGGSAAAPSLGPLLPSAPLPCPRSGAPCAPAPAASSTTTGSAARTCPSKCRVPPCHLQAAYLPACAITDAARRTIPGTSCLQTLVASKRRARLPAAPHPQLAPVSQPRARRPPALTSRGMPG